MAYILAGTVGVHNCMRTRTKKPFNPMLGETYELVTDKVRVILEKVEHTPDQIFAQHYKGRGYTNTTYSKSKQKFSLNYGKGLLDIEQFGVTDYLIEEHDETIHVGKPMV
jgi:hypothetical protein